LPALSLAVRSIGFKAGLFFAFVCGLLGIIRGLFFALSAMLKKNRHTVLGCVHLRWSAGIEQGKFLGYYFVFWIRSSSPSGFPLPCLVLADLKKPYCIPRAGGMLSPHVLFNELPTRAVCLFACHQPSHTRVPLQPDKQQRCFLIDLSSTTRTGLEELGLDKI
jgi:hypothetical protein